MCVGVGIFVEGMVDDAVVDVSVRYVIVDVFVGCCGGDVFVCGRGPHFVFPRPTARLAE